MIHTGQVTLDLFDMYFLLAFTSVICPDDKAIISSSLVERQLFACTQRATPIKQKVIPIHVSIIAVSS